MKEVSKLRESSRSIRVAQYEEAKAYIDFDWSEKHSIIIALPDEMAYFAQSFMIAYCHYFSGETFMIERQYNHELRNVLSTAEDILNRLTIRRANIRVRDDEDERHVRQCFSAIIRVAELGLIELESRWSKVAYEFARLKLHALHYGELRF
jgi:hypothetical protein